MTVNQCIEQLLEVEENRKENGLKDDGSRTKDEG